MIFKNLKIGDHFLVTDYVANGSFSSIKENVEYLDKPGYAHLLRLTDYIKNWNNNFVYVSKKSFDFLGKSTVYPGDLIVSNVGQPGIAFIAPDSKMPMTLAPNCILVRAKSNIVDNNYFAYYLKSSKGQYFIRKITSVTTLKKFNKTTFRALELPFPSLQDQIKITLVLKKIENIITERENSILMLDDLLKNKFLKMFGDPVINPKGWEKVSLQKVGKSSTGNTPSRIKPEFYSDSQMGLEWIKTDNILHNEMYPSVAKEYLSKEGEQVGRVVEPGTVLVACIAGSLSSIGKSALTNRKVSINQQINAITPNKDFNSYFIYWWFKLSKEYIGNAATSGMKMILNKGKFEQLKIIKIPIKLQKEFGDIVKKTESLKERYQYSLENLKSLFESLSQKAFKGELSLKNLSIDHITPNSSGGSDELENLQLLTVGDNSRKANKILDDWNLNKKQEIETKQVVPIVPSVTEKVRISTEGISAALIAEWIKEEFKDKHFTSEMLIRFCNKERKSIPYYFTSKELKENRKVDLSQDLKEIIFQFIKADNDYLELEQLFYNGEEENFVLDVRSQDYDLIQKKSPRERSGIYLRLKS